MILDEHGERVQRRSGRAGNMCIRNPWPGSFQTIWGQPDRYVDLYYQKYCRDPAVQTGAFSITPPGTGESVGRQVAEAVRIVQASGLPSETSATFTTVEGDGRDHARHPGLHRQGRLDCAPGDGQHQAGLAARSAAGPA